MIAHATGFWKDFESVPQKVLDIIGDPPGPGAALEPNPLFEDIPSHLLHHDQWRRVKPFSWQYSEGILLKEARGVLFGLRRKCKSVENHCQKHFFVSDNLSVVLALEKGRSSVFALNAVCRRWCALTLACGIKACNGRTTEVGPN